MRAIRFSFAIAFTAGCTPTLAATPPPKACAQAQYRQFDFWVGKWDVYAKAQPNKLVAHSLIESLYDGCAVRENWMPLNHTGGGSLNTYVSDKKAWVQFWADGQGSSALFNGKFDGKAMVMTGAWPQPGHPTQITRMTYTKLPDGSVEQLGVTSDDNQKTWQPSFEFIYRKTAK